MTGGISATAVIGAIGVGLSAVQMMTSKKGGSAAAPTVTKSPVMPTADDAATKAAERRSLAGQAQRKGRQSTILENDSTVGDLLG
jgi:hypothetical protein